MSLIVAALDADVLVPIMACDFLLTAFDLGLYEPIVSEVVLDEVRRALIDDFPYLSHAAIEFRVSAMREVLEDQIITPSGTGLPEINAKDRHIVDVAVASGASVLITHDRRLRDEVSAARLGLDVATLDEFAHVLWERDPRSASCVIDALTAKRSRPRVMREDLIAKIAPLMPSLALELTRTDVE